jgi:hypothetical protein
MPSVEHNGVVFTEWLKDNGAVLDKVVVAPSEEIGGYGMFTKSVLAVCWRCHQQQQQQQQRCALSADSGGLQCVPQKGDRIIKIPHNLVLSRAFVVQHVLRRLNDTAKSPDDAEHKMLHALVSSIDNVKIANNDAQVLAFWILIQHCLGEASEFAPWIRMCGVAHACEWW